MQLAKALAWWTANLTKAKRLPQWKRWMHKPPTEEERDKLASDFADLKKAFGVVGGRVKIPARKQ